MRIFDFRFSMFACLIVLVLMLGGCEQYQLRGRVIEGTQSMVMVVPKDDPRLTAPDIGLGGATVEATLDPQHLNRIAVPGVISQWTGDFAMPVDATGAGTLEYEVEVMGHLSGYSIAIEQFRLPGRSKRVLVVLTPGKDEPKRKTNVLDETLKLGEPYLKEH